MVEQSALHSANPDSPRHPRRRRLIVMAIAVGFLPLLLIEIGLRVLGVAAEVRYQDPLVGFSRVSPLFELDDDHDVYRTARSRQLLFGTQEFAARKPENGYRIFCLGGSTVRGRPYTTDTAFGRWIHLELAARDVNHTYEVVNCGGLSYASYRLTSILQEVLEYQPDLIVIATGHNEFLEDRTYEDIKSRSAVRSWFEDRLHQLRTVRVVRDWAGGDREQSARTVLPELVEPRLDEVSGYASYHRDEEWAADVKTHFRRALRTMVRMCNESDVPVVLVLLGSNLRDCPPFKSEHRAGLSVDEERTWQGHIDAAAALEEADPEAALGRYQSAMALDEQQALLRFRMARVLDRLGRTDEARDHYLTAKDLDVCPLRMRESFAEVERTVARETGTPLIDARAMIEAQCDAAIPGNDWYLDHVHPSIAAHQQIAAAIVSWMEENSQGHPLSHWGDLPRREAYEEHIRLLGPNYFGEGDERVSWLENWARRKRLLEETLPRTPAAHIRYGHRLWDFGRQEEAWEHYQSAMDADPEAVTTLLRRSEDLLEQGRQREANQLLNRLNSGQ